MSMLAKFKEWWSGQQSEADQVALMLEQAERATWSTAMVNDFPDSSFLYVRPGGSTDDSGKTTPRALRMFPYRDGSGAVDLPHLRNALARIPQADIPPAVRDRLTSRAQAILEKANAGKSLSAPGSLAVFTDKATGQLRWLSVVSNNFKDREGEFLVADAHREFADAVNKGMAPYPELRIWHIPGSGIGAADFVDYSGNFMVQAGTFYPGLERVAERLAAQKGLATSHGFYGVKDNNNWLWYRSYETSLLPVEAAANPLTSWEVLEGSMPFEDKERRARLVAILGEDMTKEIEGRLDGASTAAAAAGIEQKSTEPPAAPAAPDLAPLVLSVKALSDQIAGLDGRITDAVKAVADPLTSRIDATDKALGNLTDQVARLQRTEDAKMLELLTPRNAGAAGYRATADASNAPSAQQTKEVTAGKDWIDEALHWLPAGAGR